MKRNTPVSEEVIQEVLKEYPDTTVTVAQIAQKHGISSQAVSAIANRHGLPLRVNRSKTSKPRTCLNCHHKVNLLHAKYCPYCGSLIQTKQERAVEIMTKLRSMVQFIPENMCDEFSQNTQEVLNYLKNN